LQNGCNVLMPMKPLLLSFAANPLCLKENA
jgi:hypothetical protein